MKQILDKPTYSPIDKETHKKKILIVDDQVYNIYALKILLKVNLNIDVDNMVEHATSGEDALKMVINDV